MSTGDTVKDGYRRMVFDDSVNWYALTDYPGDITYCVSRFPFVEYYHLCDWVEDDPYSQPCERPLQQFKTLTQALAVLKVIEGSQS